MLGKAKGNDDNDDEAATMTGEEGERERRACVTDINPPFSLPPSSPSIYFLSECDFEREDVACCLFVLALREWARSILTL